MTRWQPDARERLESSALELFVAHGFAATTVPQITEHAGLTTRTFFRHFADKREVLFGAERELPEVVAGLLQNAPTDTAVFDLIDWSLVTVASSDRFAGIGQYLLTRRGVIETDDGLRERELRKRAVLADAIEGGLLARGFDGLVASLGAQFASSIFSTAIDRWLDDLAGPPLADVVRHSLAAARRMLDPAR